MRKETKSIGLACLLGGFIGALFALEISQSFELGKYFWGFGVLIGGGVAYFAYDFSAVRVGAKRALSETIIPLIETIISAWNWRPNKEWWKVYLKESAIMLISVFIMALTLAFYILIVPIGYIIFNEPTIPTPIDGLTLASLGTGTIIMFILLIYALFEQGIYVKEMNGKVVYFADTHYKKIGSYVKYINPISLPFWTIYYFIKGLGFIATKIPTGVSLFGKFIKTTFVYIHSDERTICLVDASIGASVGYFFGNPIIGGITGCLFGIINYEIVSIRWLKFGKAI